MKRNIFLILIIFLLGLNLVVGFDTSNSSGNIKWFWDCETAPTNGDYNVVNNDGYITTNTVFFKYGSSSCVPTNDLQWGTYPNDGSLWETDNSTFGAWYYINRTTYSDSNYDMFNIYYNGGVGGPYTEATVGHFVSKFSGATDSSVPSPLEEWFLFAGYHTAVNNIEWYLIRNNATDGANITYLFETDDIINFNKFIINVGANTFVDNAMIWDGNVTDILEEGYTPPSYDFNINLISPINNTYYNEYTQNFYFNYSYNGSTADSCGLFTNETGNFIIEELKTTGIPENTTIEMPHIFTADGTYLWNVGCNISNGTLYFANANYTIGMDKENPLIITDFINNSNTNLFINGQFNFSDNHLIYNYQLYIDDIIIQNQTNIDETTAQYNLSYYVGNLTLGEHNLNVIVTDAHTLTEISPIEYTKDKSGIKYIIKDKLFNDEYIKIYPSSYSSYVDAETTKQKDRYTFTFNRKSVLDSKSLIGESFIIESSDKIDIIEDSYCGHVVIPGLGPNGYWVDLNTGTYKNCETTKINDNSIRVTLYGLDGDRLTFNSIGELNRVEQNYTFYNKGMINISAYSALNDALITDYDIYQDGVFKQTTTNGTVYLINLDTTIYNITIVPLNFETKSVLINVTEGYTAYNFSLYTKNSLRIFIKDEITNTNITQNVTMKFTTNIATEFTNVTNTSGFYIDSLPATTYQILFSSDGYSSRTYTVTVGEHSSQELYAYLAQGTSIVTFTISDKSSNNPLEGVLINMYRLINNTWTILESKSTDITGKAQLNYLNATNYKFYLTKNGYDDYIFYLNPVLYSTYDIKMDKSSSINYTQDYDGLSIIYSPSYFINGTANPFSLIIAAPYGNLINYGITLTYPGGTATDTGTNANGEQLSVNIVPLAVTIYDTVRLDYYYTTTLSGRRNFTINLPINTPTDTNMTDSLMTANIDRTFGLGIFERILIATLTVLFVVGIATLIGQPLPGVFLGLLVFAFMVFIGFIPIWVVLPSMLIGFLMLAWKSGGY